jgi:hypothetical protein
MVVCSVLPQHRDGELFLSLAGQSALVCSCKFYNRVDCAVLFGPMTIFKKQKCRAVDSPGQFAGPIPKPEEEK